VIPKPLATTIESLAWVFSSQGRKPIYGFSRVRLVGTHGMIRIPLGRWLWPKGGPSKYGLAFELRSSARNRAHPYPVYVRFDA
jgi:hypothetical protein